MATAHLDSNRKFCVKCDGLKNNSSSGDLFACQGCQKLFCSQHVNEHRRDLDIQFETIIQEHNMIREESNEVQDKESLITKIDVWEQNSIAQIHQRATQMKLDLHLLYQTTMDRIKQECLSFNSTLHDAVENKDYAEADLTKWTERLTRLRKNLASMKDIRIQDDRCSSITSIQIQHNIKWPDDKPVELERNQLARPYEPPIGTRTHGRSLENNENGRRRHRTLDRKELNRNADCKQQ